MLAVIDGDVCILGLHRQETLGGSAFSPVNPGGTPKFIMVQAITQNIRYTLSNGQAPTAALGFQIVAGDPPILIPIATHFTPQFFREAAGAILEYQWIG